MRLLNPLLISTSAISASAIANPTPEPSNTDRNDVAHHTLPPDPSHPRIVQHTLSPDPAYRPVFVHGHSDGDRQWVVPRDDAPGLEMIEPDEGEEDEETDGGIEKREDNTADDPDKKWKERKPAAIFCTHRHINHPKRPHLHLPDATPPDGPWPKGLPNSCMPLYRERLGTCFTLKDKNSKKGDEKSKVNNLYDKLSYKKVYDADVGCEMFVKSSHCRGPAPAYNWEDQVKSIRCFKTKVTPYPVKKMYKGSTDKEYQDWRGIQGVDPENWEVSRWNGTDGVPTKGLGGEDGTVDGE